MIPAFQQVQKSYQILQQCKDKWHDTLQQCQQEIESLENLSEQYKCCLAADVGNLLQFMPDVKTKLLYKISLESDKRLNKLHDLLNNLKECSDRISKQYSYSSGIVKALPLEEISVAMETIPSLSNLVEWLNDIDIHLFQQYCCKKYLLDSYRKLNLKNKDFLKEWNKGNKETEIKMKDLLSYTQFLLADS